MRGRRRLVLFRTSHGSYWVLPFWATDGFCARHTPPSRGVSPTNYRHRVDLSPRTDLKKKRSWPHAPAECLGLVYLSACFHPPPVESSLFSLCYPPPPNPHPGSLLQQSSCERIRQVSPSESDPSRKLPPLLAWWRLQHRETWFPGMPGGGGGVDSFACFLFSFSLGVGGGGLYEVWK